jgi:hypothetical protein
MTIPLGHPLSAPTVGDRQMIAPPGVTEQTQKPGTGTSTPNKYRLRVHIQRLFDGLELIEPGLVQFAVQNRADDPIYRTLLRSRATS